MLGHEERIRVMNTVARKSTCAEQRSFRLSVWSNHADVRLSKAINLHWRDQCMATPAPKIVERTRIWRPSLNLILAEIAWTDRRWPLQKGILAIRDHQGRIEGQLGEAGAKTRDRRNAGREPFWIIAPHFRAGDDKEFGQRVRRNHVQPRPNRPAGAAR